MCDRCESNPVILVSACALVDRDGRVLITQRPEGKELGGYWEFPGGKIEHGETPEESLIRELDEELGIDVSAACLAPLTFASHAYEHFHLLMPLYVCRKWQGTATGREGQQLKWVRAGDLRSLQDAAGRPAADPGVNRSFIVSLDHSLTVPRPPASRRNRHVDQSSR